MIRRIPLLENGKVVVHWFKEDGTDITEKVVPWITKNGFTYPFNDDANFLFNLQFED